MMLAVFSNLPGLVLALTWTCVVSWVFFKLGRRFERRWPKRPS